MEKNEIVKIIDQITDYRNRRMKRDNIKWHLDKDIAGGWRATAENRTKLLEQAQKELDEIERASLELIEEMTRLYKQRPTRKDLKLIWLYIQELDMDPLKLEKHRQKINALRLKVLGRVEEIEETRQTSLFG